MQLKRRLQLKPLSPQAVANKHREAQERYYINLVTQNKHYRVIVAALAEGTDVIPLAQHCVGQGWVTVNERTFTEALRVFRRQKSELIYDYKHDDEKHVDNLVKQNAPDIDDIAVLNQMIRLQQIRIGIDVHTEKSIGKLFKDTSKEIEITAKLIETKAKIQGRISDRPHSNVESGQGVSDDLHKIKKEQVTLDRLHGLTRQLVEGKS